MATDTASHLIRNPQLVVGDDNLNTWNQPDTRRWGFRNVHWLNRYGFSTRSSHVLPLRKRIDRHIGDLPEVRRLTTTSIFDGMIVVRGQDILFESYAPDFGPDMPHSIQSISKTTLNLIFGRLVAEGLVELEAKVEHYLPEIGSGYRGATVQQVLDMNVMNNFDEDYTAPYDPPPGPGERIGYGREEISLGWRLPPEGEPEQSLRGFVCDLVDDGTTNPDNITHYKSTNSDVAAWIAEVVSGRDLKSYLVDIANGAGLERAFHMSLDCDFVPVLSGGGALTLRDLARYGLIFARGGLGVHGEPVGDSDFIEATRKGGGTWLAGPREGQRYRNQIYSNGTFVGHGGYGGQYLMADPDKEAVFAFFSVLETSHASDETYLPEVIAMGEEILAKL
ncbi:MAG: serine hydrolase [Pseudomonadota bacterium]